MTRHIVYQPLPVITELVSYLNLICVISSYIALSAPTHVELSSFTVFYFSTCTYLTLRRDFVRRLLVVDKKT